MSIEQALEEIRELAGIDEELEYWDSTTKTCNRCEQTLSTDMFYNRTAYKGGKDSYCKVCRDIYTTGNRENRAKDIRCQVDSCNGHMYAKGFCRRHYERVRKTGSIYTKTTPHNPIAHQMTIKKYNLDPEWYEYKLQQGCEICGAFTEQKLHVDHDHSCCDYDNKVFEQSCGECVRGIICHGCNANVGHYERGTIRLANPKYDMIKEYVEKHEKKRTQTI